MLTPQKADRLQRLIFGEKDLKIYAVLDGALIESLPEQLEQSGLPHACLYGGELDPELAAVVPYLVDLRPDHPLSRAAIETGWMAHWGIYLVAPQSLALRQARQHLRALLRVCGPQGEELLFRYYDPRVLRVALPAFDASQRAAFFGPLKGCFAESTNDAAVLRFDADGPAAGKPIALH